MTSEITFRRSSNWRVFPEHTGRTGVIIRLTPDDYEEIPAPIPPPPPSDDGVIYVSTYSSEDILSVACDGSTTVFATLPGDNSGIERYIAVAPTGSGFTPGDIFVTRGQDIYKITGGTPTLFVNIPDAYTDQTGICFDTTGQFDGDMIITALTGQVWRVTPGGVATLHVDTTSFGGVSCRNPCIPPLSFGTYGGQIWIADLYGEQVNVVANDTTVTTNILSFAATSLTFAPANSGGVTAGVLAEIADLVGIASYNPTASLHCGYGVYVSDFWPPGQLLAFPGDSIPTDSIILTAGAIALIAWTGSSYDTNFYASATQPETGAIVVS